SEFRLPSSLPSTGLFRPGAIRGSRRESEASNPAQARFGSLARLARGLLRPSRESGGGKGSLAGGVPSQPQLFTRAPLPCPALQECGRSAALYRRPAQGGTAGLTSMRHARTVPLMAL